MNKQPTDRVKRKLQGDEAALYTLHAKRLMRLVGQKVNVPPHVVEEACSFAWLQLVRTQPERGAIFSWLSVVSCREAIRIYRRSGRDQALSGVPSGGYREPIKEETLLAHRPDLQVSAELHEALGHIARLPERRRRIFILHLAGLRYDEIADRTGEKALAIDRRGLS